jgi:flagellar hook-associated protein 1
MSLSDAMKIAQANFANTALQTAVVSKNMTNASNPNYSRREAVLVSTSYGATIATTQRVQNDALLKQNLVSISKSVGQDTLLTGLERMKTMLGGSAYELSPSTYLSELWNDLQTFADTPSDLSLAQSVITSATDVANSLNTISGSLQKLRSEADADIAASVS